MSQTFFSPIIFPFYKAKDCGSLDLVRNVKRSFKNQINKVGHFGTLDPFAEGLLLVGANGATKINNYLHDWCPKTYIATGKFGVKKDTGDLKGQVVEECPVEEISLDKIEKAVKEKFIGKIMQVPPVYSAVKIDGKRSYELAREGKFIEKPAVQREVYALNILELSKEEIIFEVKVNSGTYIRKLFEDLCLEINTLGHLVELKRSMIGDITVSNCFKESDFPFDNFERAKELALCPSKILPLSEIVLEGKQLDLSKQGHTSALSSWGKFINPNSKALKADYYWIKDCKQNVVGMRHMNDEINENCFNFPLLQS